MQQQGLGLHETLELHELMVAKTVCLAEDKARQQLVQDPALKALLQQNVQLTTQAITEIQGVLSKANIQ
jgi:similar to spore coat protein